MRSVSRPPGRGRSSPPPRAGRPFPRDRRARCHYGRAACAEIISRRPDAIDRVFLEAHSPPGPILRSLIRQRVAHREVAEEELERLAQSQHHEGVVIFAKPRTWPAWEALVARPGPAQLALVDEGLNPHNLGAILRSAGYFGVGGVGAVGGPAQVVGAAARIAEGAAEVVAYARVEDGAVACRQARGAGFAVVATAAEGEMELFDWRPGSGRVLWLLGQERRGLAAALRGEAEATIRIPGTGDVQSLNVAVAAGLVFAEGWRFGARAPHPADGAGG